MHNFKRFKGFEKLKGCWPRWDATVYYNKKKLAITMRNFAFSAVLRCVEGRNTEGFEVPIFPHSDWTRWDTEYLSVFSSNAEKYGPEKTPY